MQQGGLDEGPGDGLGICENKGSGLGMHVAVGFGLGGCCFGARWGKLLWIGCMCSLVCQYLLPLASTK